MAFLGAPLNTPLFKNGRKKKSAPREQTLVPQTQPGDEFQSTTRKTFLPLSQRQEYHLTPVRE